MTTYNRAQYIEEAIESVIKSTYQNWELIIVDDCSTDNTQELVKKYFEDKRIKYYRNKENLGQFPNRNKAASLAKGKYLKYLDSDDVIYSFGLDILVNALEIYPEAAIAIASQDTHPTEFRYPQLVNSEEAYRTYFFNDALLTIGPTGTMFKKEAFDKVKGYTDTHATADTQLMLNLAALYPVVRVQPSFFYYRIHNDQVLNQSDKIKTYAIEAYRNGLQAIKHCNCPLDQQEKKNAIKLLQKRVLKVGCYQIIKKVKFRLGFSILKVLFQK
jgi:glycosyltransferase involved in cell wall biosynthesis